MAVEPAPDGTDDTIDPAGRLGLLGRSVSLAFATGYAYGHRRDYYENFGWTRSPTATQYYASFLRNPYASAVVSVPAQTTWRNDPRIEDRGKSEAGEQTAFEDDVEAFVRATRCWHYGKRLQVLSRIGEFGVLVVGWADGEDQSFADPVDAKALAQNDPGSAVRWLRPFSQVSVKEIELSSSPGRFGRPESYTIDFGDAANSESRSTSVSWDESTNQEQKVHHSRVIHYASGLLDDEVFGRPAQQAVYNALTDIQKTLGSAAEIAYSIARPILHANIDKDANLPDGAKEDIDSELTAVSDELQPYFRSQGVDLKAVSGDQIDPTPVLNSQIQALSAHTGIPQKYLKGNESGEIAGAKDLESYYGNIGEIRTQDIGPQICRELVQRNLDFGVFRPPSGNGFDVKWDPPADQDESQVAEIHERRASAANKLGQYFPGLTTADAVEFVETGEFPELDAPADAPPPMNPAEDAGAPPASVAEAIADGGEGGEERDE